MNELLELGECLGANRVKSSSQKAADDDSSNNSEDDYSLHGSEDTDNFFCVIGTANFSSTV